MSAPKPCAECGAMFLAGRSIDIYCKRDCMRRGQIRLQTIRRREARLARRRVGNLPREDDRLGTVDVQEFLAARRPVWARDPEARRDAWAGYSAWEVIHGHP